MSLPNPASAQPTGRLLFDMSVPGRRAALLPPCDVLPSPLPPAALLREELTLPEVSEVEVVRYFTHLSTLNYSVETGMYPLGSCTMKYNPKRQEDIARLPGFSWAHPLAPAETVQGALQVLYELQGYLGEITGMAGVSLAPMAGAHGELAGILMVRAYHQSRADLGRRKVLVPDSAHGTNPATAAMAGYEVVAIPSDQRGNCDLEHLRAALGPDVAALMLTQPNTLGLFDTHILEIAAELHRHGALLYGDGANMNALLGRAKPGDMGFDVIHLNLHKTFSTPHGGGGPGAGPVCVKPHLADFLPTPVVALAGEGASAYRFSAPSQTIGRMGGFHGNFGVLLRAYAYIRTLGPEGLREVTDNAVLNANYVRAQLTDLYAIKYDRTCMHEVVLAGTRQKAQGANTLAIAKRLIDYGFHPPTIYFPLIVEEALMIEPTETESRQTLDAFVAALRAIAREAEEDPELLRTAPHFTPVGRLDEATAARRPYLRWKQPQG
ncbi:MAG: aminomethyl-transferring glycine dehydrogenase subunit GcvPB [Chloroflexi bacterium]|nr:aminomethyl-transferring glycine dehydrogenase subunit GcvPB [Chloroflexota bacterium]